MKVPGDHRHTYRSQLRQPLTCQERSRKARRTKYIDVQRKAERAEQGNTGQQREAKGQVVASYGLMDRLLRRGWGE